MELTDVLSRVAGLYADTTPFARVQRARFEALLAEKPPIPGVIARLVACLKNSGAWEWVHPSIVDDNFPTTDEPRLDGAQLDEIAGLWGEVLAELELRGRRAANCAEGLLYAAENPDEHRQYNAVWCLGQVYVLPDNRREHAVMLSTNVAGGSQVYLTDATGGVLTYDRVLSFPMTEAELAARDARTAERHND